MLEKSKRGTVHDSGQVRVLPPWRGPACEYEHRGRFDPDQDMDAKALRTLANKQLEQRKARELRKKEALARKEKRRKARAAKKKSAGGNPKASDEEDEDEDEDEDEEDEEDEEPAPRPYRGLLHYLVADFEEDVADIQDSLPRLWDRYNSRYDYPVVLFHDGMSAESRAKIVNSSKTAFGSRT